MKLKYLLMFFFTHSSIKVYIGKIVGFGNTNAHQYVTMSRMPKKILIHPIFPVLQYAMKYLVLD